MTPGAKKISPERRRKAKAFREGYEAGYRAAVAQYAPEARQQHEALSGAIHALEQVLPDANWSIAKGRIKDDEAPYAVVIFDHLTAIGAAEGDGDLADIVRQATEAAIFGTWTEPLAEEPVSQNIIQQIALVASNVGHLAGEPAMEIAGQIVSVLAANPELTADFLARGGELFIEGHLNSEHGCLPYRAANGSIVSPAERRQQMGMVQ